MGSIRSRNGCRQCKKWKIKCDENKPRCKNCCKRNIKDCDYSIILKWGGRPYKNAHRTSVQLIPQLKLKNGVFILNKNNAKVCKKSSEDISVSIDDTKPLSCVIEPLENFLVRSPSLLPSILTSSHYNMVFFEFYLQETSHMLIPTSPKTYLKNPFKLLLPQMAMQNETLLYLLLAFGATHKGNFLNEPSTLLLPSPSKNHISSANLKTINLIEIDNEYLEEPCYYLDDIWSSKKPPAIADDLLATTLKNLSMSLDNIVQRTRDETLATILMLSMFDIFFSDNRRVWRKHLFGARTLINEKIKMLDVTSFRVDLFYNEMDPTFFLNRWFTYVDIVSSLSSINQNSMDFHFDTFRHLSYEVQKYETDEDFLYNKRYHLDDIEYCTGLDPKILYYLGKISTLVNQSYIDQEVEMKARKLDQELIQYLYVSECERDKIHRQYYQTNDNANYNNNTTIAEKYQTYELLRATNVIYGLTGSLQLKRRVFGYSSNHYEVEKLIQEITNLLIRYIPPKSSSAACIIFCLFCCGCDLFDNTCLHLRDVYMERVVTLANSGVKSAYMAKTIMQQCWKLHKNWWEYLEEEQLDVTFAI